jgi:NAD(P)-dependent dehydrogenase (short-subunit alcohol dehydrogenase family)
LKYLSNSEKTTAEKQVVIITGAARRIGRAIAVSLAGAGWHVVLHCNHSEQECHELAADIRAKGGAADVVTADLGNIDAVMTLLPCCVDVAGPPACLVNNASLFLKDEMGGLSPERWQAHMGVNLRAPVFLAQAFAAALPEDATGAVINLIDQRVLRPRPGFFSYTISKAGLWWATQTMAQALAPRVRVNAIAPGPVLPSIHQSRADFDSRRAGALLGRGAEPEHIAAAVRFILDTPSMTGQMIALDGGQHLTFPDG